LNVGKLGNELVGISLGEASEIWIGSITAIARPDNIAKVNLTE
jgi:hypothetical protein